MRFLDCTRRGEIPTHPNWDTEKQEKHQESKQIKDPNDQSLEEKNKFLAINIEDNDSRRKEAVNLYNCGNTCFG